MIRLIKTLSRRAIFDLIDVCLRCCQLMQRARSSVQQSMQQEELAAQVPMYSNRSAGADLPQRGFSSSARRSGAIAPAEFPTPGSVRR
jgi:hypothetical protein